MHQGLGFKPNSQGAGILEIAFPQMMKNDGAIGAADKI